MGPLTDVRRLMFDIGSRCAGDRQTLADGLVSGFPLSAVPRTVMAHGDPPHRPLRTVRVPVVTYSKSIIPGPTPTPTLISTTSDGDILMPQLIELGWGWFGDDMPAHGTGELRITHDRLALVVDDQTILDDINPASPPGWWDAVDGLGGLCVVIVVRHEDAGDFNDPDFGARMQGLMSGRRGVWALLPVRS